MGTPTFGVFDHIEGISGRSVADVLKDRLDLVRMADEAGFAGYHLAEHHGSELCLVPNQELFIAAASQITDSIRMGPMVKLLPLHHPVSLIEDLCVADNLTNGRVDFGVGRGPAPVEHFWFGSDWPTAAERFEDVLGIICRALRSGEISSEGSRFYDFRTMPAGDPAGAGAHPVLVSRQPGHRWTVRAQPDVAGPGPSRGCRALRRELVRARGRRGSPRRAGRQPTCGLHDAHRDRRG